MAADEYELTSLSKISQLTEAIPSVVYMAAVEEKPGEHTAKVKGHRCHSVVAELPHASDNANYGLGVIEKTRLRGN